MGRAQRNSGGRRRDLNLIFNGFKLYSNSFIDRSKNDLLEQEKFEIKYGCEGFEERNNFLHSNFFRSKMDFELKIWEFKVCF
jgi:hypothetical protein